jgi:hypothetical protein
MAQVVEVDVGTPGRSSALLPYPVEVAGRERRTVPRAEQPGFGLGTDKALEVVLDRR